MEGNIIVDDNLLKRLTQEQDTIDIYSKNGDMVGHMISHEEYTRLLYAEMRSKPIPAEVIEAAKNITEGYTLTEILAELEK